MKRHLADIFLLVTGLGFIVLLLYLGARSDNWVAPLCFLGVAVVFHTWWRILLNLGWRLAGRDPEDFDFRFPG